MCSLFVLERVVEMLCVEILCGIGVGSGWGWGWGFEAGRGILAVKVKIAARSKRNGMNSGGDNFKNCQKMSIHNKEKFKTNQKQNK